MKAAWLLLAALSCSGAFAQRSFHDLTEAQQATVRSYVARHPSLRVALEHEFDPQVLRWARTEFGFGPRFAPYYQRGDFNGDGKMDFALMLVNARTSEYHLAVFNQAAGNRYVNAFGRAVGATTDNLFVHVRGRQLYYGTMESDHCVDLVPRGGRYVERACR